MRDRKPIPVLYVKSVKGSLYRNGSVNLTLYFHMDPDQELLETDPQYEAYFQDMISHEIPQAIVNKFVTSQPLVVTNDKIPFVIFKSNIDQIALTEFCKAIVQEFSFHTGKEHSAQFGLTKAMFCEMDKEPLGIRFSPKGDKLSRSKDFEEMKKDLDYDRNLIDQGIMVPYDAWKEEKRREALKAAGLDEEEEIVEW